MTARFLKFAAQTDYNEWAITNIINESRQVFHESSTSLPIKKTLGRHRVKNIGPKFKKDSARPDRGRADAQRGCWGMLQKHPPTTTLAKSGIGYRMRSYARA